MSMVANGSARTDFAIRECCDKELYVAIAAQDFDGFRDRMGQPGVANAFTGINRELLAAIDPNDEGDSTSDTQSGARGNHAWRLTR